MMVFKRSDLFIVLVMASAMLSGCIGDEPQADGPMSETASALASDCAGGRNGFIDISDSLVGSSRPRSVSIASGVTATLEVGTVAGAQRGWAKLNGSTQPGDLVWMDWTQNGGTSWLQCGPFQVDNARMSKTSAAKQTNPSPRWQFRACGRRPLAASACSAWW